MVPEPGGRSQQQLERHTGPVFRVVVFVLRMVRTWLNSPLAQIAPAPEEEQIAQWGGGSVDAGSGLANCWGHQDDGGWTRKVPLPVE